MILDIIKARVENSPLYEEVIFMLKHPISMTEEEKQMFVEMNGKMILYIAERRSLLDIAKKLGVEAWQVDHNIDEMLYTLRKSLGWKRFIKALFIK